MTGLHRLLVNQAGTFLGDALLIAAFPLLAVHVTRSPALISAVGASATLPWVVVGLPSGLAADRWERRRLMASASLPGCLLLLALAAIVGAGHDSVATLAASSPPATSAASPRVTGCSPSGPCRSVPCSAGSSPASWASARCSP
jgi:MFS family permease